jgi:predicted alpha/beta-hydrolase family hydrolase
MNSEHRFYPAAHDRCIGATFVFAHGAGAGQASGFMVAFSTALAARGLDVVTFDFPYMREKRKVPDRADKLEACYRAVVNEAREEMAGNRIIIGGKSMGGRMASHLAAAPDNVADGLVLFGYPLHPPGKPEQLRVAHLSAITIPVLCLQGARDPFGSPEELRPHFARIQGRVTLHTVENGDHSLAPSRSKPAIEKTYGELQDLVAGWVQAL